MIAAAQTPRRTRYEGLVIWLEDARINLATGEWSDCITLDRDQWSEITPPAHVVAQIGGK